MPHDAVVLMPSFGDCPVRLANQAFVIRWYAEKYGLPTVLGLDEKGRKWFSRARAINRAAREALQSHPKRDILIICDNDLTPDDSPFRHALRIARNVPAACPHLTTLLMTTKGTEQFRQTGEAVDYRALRSGSKSFVVISRANFELVNGMDELFEGWGGEDGAFIHSITKQLGAVVEMHGKRAHMWHPTDPSKADQESRVRNRQRCRMYQNASRPIARRLAREYGPLNLRGDAHAL